MGPLVPDVIGPNLNFVVALFIGIAFGWILEQAGFSTSKKLVGLFYGYDFTVLRVFLTAGIVAITGVGLLLHYGWLDMNLTYINPTFIWSAIVGGLVMGLGFVVGGFCPGTSVCAAAIGKIDAMLFIAGSAIGVLVFAEGYPLFEGLYKAGHWGNPQMFDTLGVSKGLFTFLLVVLALGAFWAVSLVEARVHGEKPLLLRVTKQSLLVGLVGIVVALTGFLLPPRKDMLLQDAYGITSDHAARISVMTPDELAFRIMDHDRKIQVLDFRTASEVPAGRLPKAVAFTAENLFEKEPAKILARRHILNIFVAADETTERRMAGIAAGLGYGNLRVLAGGYGAFEADILRFDTTRSPITRQEMDTFRFRKRARATLPAMIAASRSTGTATRKAKRVVGGC
jgi:hypothetical protein